MNRDNNNYCSNYVFVGSYVANGKTDTIRGTRGREPLTLLLDRSGAYVVVLPECLVLGGRSRAPKIGLVTIMLEHAEAAHDRWGGHGTERSRDRGASLEDFVPRD